MRMAVAVRFPFQFSPSREGGPANCAAYSGRILFQFSPSREGGQA